MKLDKAPSPTPARIKSAKIWKAALALWKKKKTELGSTLKRLETGAGEEEELRKRFNIQKAGERTLIIVERNLGSESLSGDGLNNDFLKRFFIFLKNAIY